MRTLFLGLLLAVVVGWRSDAQSDVQVALREAERLGKAGDTGGALESYKSALGESQPGSRDRAEALSGLAQLQTGMGRYADAVTNAREAAGIFGKLGDPRRVTGSLSTAGRAHLYGGNYAEAEQAFRSALDVATKAGDRAARAEQLGNLANVQFFVSRYAEAARLNDEALALTNASSSEPWAPRRRFLILANQASLYQRLGRDREALAVYQALGMSSDELRPEEQAQLLVNLGVLYRRLGDPVKALETYDRARALFARDRQVDGELHVLNNRGIVLALDLDRLAEAEQSFTEALGTASRAGNRREMLHARLYRGETHLRRGDREQARDDFAAGLALARELRTPEEVWKALYGLGRVAPTPEQAHARLTEAVSTIEQVHENIRVPSLRSEFLNDKRDVYDALIAARMAASPDDVFELLERSHSRGWRERLGLSPSVELKSVQRALPAGAMLLDFWNAPAGSAVIAVTRSRAAVRRIAVDEARIKALIDSLAAGPSERSADLASALSGLLPGAEWFDGIDHVIVIPDGAVALVPFELLPVGGRPLIQRAAVSYTPTAAMLLRPAPTGPVLRPPWRLQLRVFADPVAAASSLDDVAGLRGRLTASHDEATQIASEVAGGAVLHLGADNRKAHLYSRTERAPMLHLATHAMADASAMEQSRILFSPSSQDGSNADYLFLKEAYELPLDGVELAVLSACDTERGHVVRGEGVQSFSRAFLASGARSTVTTLWRVADQPTAEFMKIFYHHLQQGLARDEALRRAKLRFIESQSPLSDPHYWAAFVLTGDAVRPVARVVPWTVILIPPIAAVTFWIGLVHVLRRRRRAV